MMVGALGETTIPISVGAVTVSEVLSLAPKTLAVMVVLPAARALAKPALPGALLIVATPVTDEDQLASVVRSCVVLSEKLPVAVNCCDLPVRIDGARGSTVSETSVAEVMVSEVLPVLPENAAAMAVLPAPTPLARPAVPPPLLTVAMAGFIADHVAIVVRSCVVPSE